MKFRNNESRLGAKSVDANPPVIPEDIESEETTESRGVLQFATPTTFVELPTKGRYYPDGHPLHNQETIEIRFMTAKDEDILSSKTLLKKGLAIDRLLQNVIVDKNIKVNDLYVGDKNAVIIASRITGYGANYLTNITCPVCGSNTEYEFNLEEGKTRFGGPSDKYNVSATEKGTFVVRVPTSNVDVEVRLLTSADEQKLLKLTENRRKQKLPETTLTNQLRMFIVSVNGQTETGVISSFINNMPALDSRYLRNAYKEITPSIDLSHDFVCDQCTAEVEMEVPMTADFFWPRR
tara:strand:+ start:965 stop:1843 length:879 start_codon:yes stop_codon:yes gene_type:complete